MCEKWLNLRRVVKSVVRHPCPIGGRVDDPDGAIGLHEKRARRRALEARLRVGRRAAAPVVCVRRDCCSLLPTLMPASGRDISRMRSVLPAAPAATMRRPALRYTEEVVTRFIETTPTRSALRASVNGAIANPLLMDRRKQSPGARRRTVAALGSFRGKIDALGGDELGVSATEKRRLFRRRRWKECGTWLPVPEGADRRPCSSHRGPW